MVYNERFSASHPDIIALLDACARLHIEPMIYLESADTIVGCNEPLLELLEIGELNDLTPLSAWFEPVGEELSAVLEQSGSYRGKIRVKDREYSVEVKSQSFPIDEGSVIGIVFHDTTVLDRAKAAERYFEDFKRKFLTNISHEFRTPMNGIIGFTDLLKNTPLSSWQQEYLDMTSRSAMSMMRNIENMLELMQVESGDVRLRLAPYNPLDVYENFSMQFGDAAAAKDIKLMFLIDPHLPKSIVGDQDKILSIMRNLVLNGIKFTNDGGQVLVEILLIKSRNNVIVVEYAVSDTGIGIEKEKIKTLLRPFASGWENQRKGQEGLGVGLSLSHKYVDMMNSHLMLASEEGKGSRFSFRIAHEVSEHGTFDFVEGTKALIYTQEENFSEQGSLLYKYLQLFKVETKGVHDLINPLLSENDILFLDLGHVSKSQIDAIKSAYENLHVVPIMKLRYGDKTNGVVASSGSLVTVPILPSSLHKTLAVVWNKMPKEYITQSPEAQSVPAQENIKILIAEDNPINLKLLQTILEQEHFQVTAVDNGQKAVDAYLMEQYDLILMDIDMPVMDGLTANRLIKEIDKKADRGYVPVIALTAHALIGDREWIVSAGLDAHLPKPIDKHFLLQTIDRYLKIAQQKRVKKAV